MEKNVELIAIQSLLLGMELSARKSIEALNEVRAFVGMPTIDVSLFPGAPKTPSGLEELLERLAQTPNAANDGGRKPWAKASREKVAESAKRRWEIVREAGIEAEANGRMPSNKLVQKALRIIERRKKKEQETVHAVRTRGAGAI